ncbi:hypothetical protein D3C83_272640 [compost metagenome]
MVAISLNLSVSSRSSSATSESSSDEPSASKSAKLPPVFLPFLLRCLNSERKLEWNCFSIAARSARIASFASR